MTEPVAAVCATLAHRGPYGGTRLVGGRYYHRVRPVEVLTGWGPDGTVLASGSATSTTVVRGCARSAVSPSDRDRSGRATVPAALAIVVLIVQRGNQSDEQSDEVS